MTETEMTRRGLLKSGALGVFVLSVGQAGAVAKAPSSKSLSAPADFGIYLGIAEDGAVSIVSPSSEMGQGVYEALARMVAEELDCDWAGVIVRAPWADEGFRNPIAKIQRTANSESVPGFYLPLRKVGAAAREMLVAAAAQQWDVEPASLVTASGRITHGASGRSIGYGEIAAAAARLPVPEEPKLKDPKDFKLIGKSIPRKDIAPKVFGTAEFGADVYEPGMVTAMLALAPHPLCKVTKVDSAAALKLPGVIKIVPVDAGVAVIADGFWHARKASEAVALSYDPPPTAGLDDETIGKRYAEALETVPGQPFPEFDFSVNPPKFIYPDRSRIAEALSGAATVLDMTYDVPHLAHAAMEPLVCSAKLTPEGLLVRGPLQAPEVSRQVAAETAGVPIDKVRVEMTYLGGGFGRKWAADFVRVAVQAAMAMPGRMVRTIWTREQDFAIDQFRPAFRARTRAGLSEAGEIVGMHSQITGPSIWHYQKRKPIPGMPDPTVAAKLIYDRYKFPDKLIEFHEVNLGIPVGYWRGVTLTQVAFFAESVIDEIAAATKQDPYQMRRKLLSGPRQERLLAVMDKAAEMIGWDKPAEPNVGRGITITYSTDTFCAMSAEVEVTDRALKLRRIACSFDCGRIIDPASVEAQISGGIVFGLQAALWGDVPFDDGRPQVQNFGDYRMPLIMDVPPIDVHLVQSEETPGGAGEASTPLVAPAICNAIARAGGPRVRQLPLSKSFDI